MLTKDSLGEFLFSQELYLISLLEDNRKMQNELKESKKYSEQSKHPRVESYKLSELFPDAKNLAYEILTTTTTPWKAVTIWNEMVRFRYPNGLPKDRLWWSAYDAFRTNLRNWGKEKKLFMYANDDDRAAQHGPSGAFEYTIVPPKEEVVLG